MRMIAAILFIGFSLLACPDLQAQKKPAAKPKSKTETRVNPDGPSVTKMLTRTWYAVYYDEGGEGKGDSIPFGGDESMFLSFSSSNTFQLNLIETPMVGKWSYSHDTKTILLKVDNRLVESPDLAEIKMVITSISESKLKCTMMIGSDGKEDAVEVIFLAYKPE